MPITQSAKKALRQNQRRRTRNTTVKIALKEKVKRLKQLADRGQSSDLSASLAAAYQALDKAAKRRVIAANTARRLKSRLAKLARRAALPHAPVSPI